MTFQQRFAAASPWEQELQLILQARGWLAAPFGQAQIPEAMRRHLVGWQDEYGRPTLLRWAPDIIATHEATGRVCLIDAKTDDSDTPNYAVEVHAVDAGLAIVQHLFTPVYYVWRSGTLTPEVVLNRWHRRQDGKRAKGSRTSFYLVDKSFAVKGSSVFGDVIQEAS